MDTHLLEEIGLTKGEIAVYYALLELGSSTVGPIVSKAKVSSSKVYDILDRLIGKGLVSYVVKESAKHFESVHPKRIMDYVEEKEKDIQSQKEKLRSLIPELELKRTLSKYQSEATIYRGIKGVETAFYSSLDMISKDDEMLVMGIPKRSELVNRFFVKFGIDRAKRGIRMKALFNENARDDLQAQEANNPNSEIRFMPETTPAAINVFKDRTIIFPETEEPLLIAIDSKEVAESFRVQFEMWWDQKIKTYQGLDAVKGLFRETLNFGDYVVFAEGMKIVDVLGEDFFVWWQGEKKKRGIKSRGIMGERYGDLVTVTKSVTDFKLIPGYENPGITLVFKDKVINVILSDDPIAFLIENKQVADSNRIYFELFWGQKVKTYVGEGATSFFTNILSDLKKGEEYFVLNGNYGDQQELRKFFTTYHKQRNKKGVKANFLFNRNAEKVIDKLTLEPSVHKFLPRDFNFPLQITFYKDKLYISLWGEKPIGFLLQDESIVKAFKAYYDTLWNQDTTVVRGLDAVQDIFEDMLKYDSCDFIGARGYFVDLRPKYIDRWEKRAIKANFKMRNIVDPGVKGHRITKFRFAETKYTLKKEFADLSVFWIYGGTVVISNWMKEEPMAIIIDNMEMYEIYKKQFELLWDA